MALDNVPLKRMDLYLLASRKDGLLLTWFSGGQDTFIMPVRAYEHEGAFVFTIGTLMHELFHFYVMNNVRYRKTDKSLALEELYAGIIGKVCTPGYRTGPERNGSHSEVRNIILELISETETSGYDDLVVSQFEDAIIKQHLGDGITAASVCTALWDDLDSFELTVDHVVARLQRASVTTSVRKP